MGERVAVVTPPLWCTLLEAEKLRCRARSFSNGGSDGNFQSYYSLPQKTYGLLCFSIIYYGFEGVG